MKYLAFILTLLWASLAQAGSTYLSKFDLKGNLIWKFLVAADLGSLGDTPFGIETDGNIFAIVINQVGSIGVTRIYFVNKKGQQIRIVNAPSAVTYGVTTDRNKWIFNDATNIKETDKKLNLKRTAAVTKTYLATTHNGKNIIAAPNAAAALDLLDPKTYSIAQTITMGFALAGVAHVGNRLAVIDSGGTALYYYSYAGQQIKGYALPGPPGELYRDLCHDGEFLWILSYTIPDIDPPKDE